MGTVPCVADGVGEPTTPESARAPVHPAPTRLGVLDVGSNTVHLLVVDAQRGGHPEPAASIKSELHLAELLDPAGAITPAGAARLVESVERARAAAESYAVEDLVAFATSAVRDAPNGEEVLGELRKATGVDLQVLPGKDEARLTFLAVRRWFGWSAGRLLVLDIGGGSLECAAGRDEVPDVAVSLPLGAGRLHRDRLAKTDPPRRSDVKALRSYVREQLEAMPDLGDADHHVATSKTFRSLARIAGAAPYSLGPRVPRHLRAEDAEDMVGRIARMTALERTRLPGVSASRAPQLLAGAVVAAAVMRRLGVDQLEICPWALREGVILRRLDWLAEG
jgi:exopolyphosphatase/guanosine-5'-triphosphate,3'-diphosphate pyrophosphatase